MTIKDMHANVRTKTVIAPIAIGANATKTGVVVDRQGFCGVEFLSAFGAVTTTGTVATLVVKDGDATGALASVADAYLLGTEALASLPAATPRTAGTTKEVTKRVGYVGTKRYVSCDVVSTGVTSVGCVAVTAVLHSPESAPLANP